MRRKEKEVKKHSEIEEIIKKAMICRLGLSLNNEPYIVPMNFGYKDKVLYFHCAKKGKKTDIIKQNNHVCFELEADTSMIKGEHACIDWKMFYESVIGNGKAYIIEDAQEKIKALDIIMAQYSGSKKYEYTDKNIRGVSVIKVEVETMSGKKAV